jgi:transposase
MSYTIYKALNNRKYAYEVTSYWNPELKQSRRRTKYLGVVDENNNIVTKSDRSKERLILDFGDGYLLNEFINNLNIFPLIDSLMTSQHKEIIPLICYRLCMQSAMYNAPIWLEANIVKVLHKDIDLSSQNISRILSFLGSEALQRNFFEQYLKIVGGAEQSIIIDATSLPNRINTGFNAWGYSDSHIEKQFRFLCVIDQKHKVPLFYRYLPGNLSDIITLQNTITELQNMGVKNSFVLIDAGYFSAANIDELYNLKIDFLTRMPSSRALYKSLIHKEIDDLEKIEHAVKYNKRILFIKKVEIALYAHKAYAYIVLDPLRKSKELDAHLNEYLGLTTEEQDIDKAKTKLNKCGIMILISSKNIEASEVVSCYYMRQSVEQIFGFMKDDLDALPIRRHNDDTIRGYLFLQFIILVIFVQLRQKLEFKYTVEQALLQLRNLKCKVFPDQLLIAESTKHQKNVFNLCNVLVPKSLGI